ncbi:MAG: sulfatase-like hydrolase/transferase, partial [Planctomycetaceae bacterium]
VLFTVDNGWIQETGETRTTRGWFAPKSKLSPYDGGLRFPLLIRWPGQLAPARRDDLVSSIDVVPTLLAAAGAPLRWAHRKGNGPGHIVRDRPVDVAHGTRAGGVLGGQEEQYAT